MIRPIAAFVAAAAAVTATAPAAPSPHASLSSRGRSGCAVGAWSGCAPLRTAGHPAPPPAASGGAAFDLGVWTVHASSVDANFKNGDFSTPAKIVMTRDGGDVTADKANGNYKKQVVYLNGHVVMHDNKGDYGGMAGSASSSNNAPSTLTCRQSADRRSGQRI